MPRSARPSPSPPLGAAPIGCAPHGQAREDASGTQARRADGQRGVPGSGSGFGPSGPPGPAHSAGKFCGRHRERREAREGKPRGGGTSGRQATLLGCGEQERGEGETPVRAPSTRALEPGARPAAHSSRRGPQGSERSAPQAASPALQVPRGALDTWRPKANISGGGRADPGVLAGEGFTVGESWPAALDFARTKGPTGVCAVSVGAAGL